MAKQTEQVILPVIIIAITRHEGLVMDLLILHAVQRQPLRLSKGKSMMMCFFFFFSPFPVGRVTLVRVAMGVEKGSRGNLAFEGEVNE